MRFQFILSEIGIGLRRNIAMTVSVILVTAVSLFLVGFGLIWQKQVDSLKDYWYGRVQVSLFLCGADSDAASCADGAVTEAQKSQIEADLGSPQLTPYVKQVFYESKQEAYDHFRDQFPDSVLSQNVTVDQMPESYRVQLKNPEQYQVVSDLFHDRAGIEEVRDQNKVLDPLFALLNGLKWGAWVVAAITLFCCVLLVAVTIRLTAFTRRRETSIMRLVGASNVFIQLPFILESLIAATVGAALASAVLVGFVKFGVQGWLADNLRFIAWIDTSAISSIIPVLFIVGWTIAGVSAFLALRRYIKV
jgi:cell division transport system permease protein